MSTKYKIKRTKTFPLEMEDELHRALKHKAIESDKSLHSFIIETLSAKLQEAPGQYHTSANSKDKSKEDHQ